MDSKTMYSAVVARKGRAGCPRKRLLGPWGWRAVRQASANEVSVCLGLPYGQPASIPMTRIDQGTNSLHTTINPATVYIQRGIQYTHATRTHVVQLSDWSSLDGRQTEFPVTWLSCPWATKSSAGLANTYKHYGCTRLDHSRQLDWTAGAQLFGTVQPSVKRAKIISCVHCYTIYVLLTRRNHKYSSSISWEAIVCVKK